MQLDEHEDESQMQSMWWCSWWEEGRHHRLMICWEMRVLHVVFVCPCLRLIQNLTIQLTKCLSKRWQCQPSFEVNQKLLLGQMKRRRFQHQHGYSYLIYVCNLVGAFVLNAFCVHENKTIPQIKTKSIDGGEETFWGLSHPIWGMEKQIELLLMWAIFGLFSWQWLLCSDDVILLIMWCLCNINTTWICIYKLLVR